MMCAVADTKTSNDSQRDGGVLANLPRTRPQRSSARRAAARGATAPATRTRKATAGKPPQAGSNGAVASPSPARTAAVGGADRSPKAKSRVRATRPAAATKRSTAPRTAARKRRAQPIADAAPRQGFECDGETSGGSVQPPGGAEFVATAAEIVGELAKAGLSTGERLFKDVLSRLPLS
jgi:hypothetical protein